MHGMTDRVNATAVTVLGGLRRFALTRWFGRGLVSW